MNFFLHINRKILLFFSLTVLIFFTIIVISKQISLNKNVTKEKNTRLSNIDIEEPKFAINNTSKKINITAQEGNFLNKDEILLRKNVKFKSNDFIIETDNVVFNRNKQTARSKTKSLFKSEKTTIFSDGFNIFDKGNRIIFYGNSQVILKWIFYLN